MFTLFSLGFSALFVAFTVAAIVGHVLLVEAFVRPFGVIQIAAVQHPATLQPMTR
jgi:hypothetical protein